jgi:proliferating cell nuclear antigen PCNA
MKQNESTLKCVIGKADFFQAVISAASGVLSEAELKFGKDGMRAIGKNASNTMMVEFEIPFSSMTGYQVSKDVSIGVSMIDLKSILSRMNADDNLIIESDGKKFKMTFKSSRVREFELSVIDVEAEKMLIMPELKFNSEVKLFYKVMQDALDDIALFSDEVVIKLTKEMLTLSGKADLEEVKIDVPGDDEVKINFGSNASSKFNIEFIKTLMMGWKLNDHPTISLGSHYPLLVDFSNEKAGLKFVVAPRSDVD